MEEEASEPKPWAKDSLQQSPEQGQLPALQGRMTTRAWEWGWVGSAFPEVQSITQARALMSLEKAGGRDTVAQRSG